MKTKIKQSINIYFELKEIYLKLLKINYFFNYILDLSLIMMKIFKIKFK